MSRSKKIDLDEFDGAGATIGEVLGLGVKRAEEPPREREKKSEPPARGDVKFAQATLHRETSGRGGRTVTAVALKPQPDERTASELAKTMRRALGCGSRVEGARIILQGDIQDRAKQWLESYGVKKVVLGN